MRQTEREMKIAEAYRSWAILENAKHNGGRVVVTSDPDENDTVAIKIVPTNYPKPTWKRFLDSDEYSDIPDVPAPKPLSKKFDDIDDEDISLTRDIDDDDDEFDFDNYTHEDEDYLL